METFYQIDNFNTLQTMHEFLMKAHEDTQKRLAELIDENTLLKDLLYDKNRTQFID